MPTLMPREHGTYAEILLPLTAVLLAGELSVAAVLLAIAAVATFLAHEPMLVLLGRRGERARKALWRPARAWLAFLVTLAVGFAVAVFSWGDPLLRAAIVAPLGLASWMAILIARGEEKTTHGEIVAAATLASAAVPIGIAAGLAVETVVLIAFVWAIGSALATAAVRGILLAAKRTRSWQPEGAIVAAVLVLAIAASLSASGIGPAWLAPALCPLALLSLALGAFAPRPAHIRRMGWAFVAANLVTLGIVVTGA